MKKTLPIIGLLCCMLLLSCSMENLDSSPQPERHALSFEKVSPGQALGRLKKLRGMFPTGSSNLRMSVVSDSLPPVADISTLTMDVVSPEDDSRNVTVEYAYVVNFVDNQGAAIMSAIEGFPEIFVYLDNGNLEVGDDGNITGISTNHGFHDYLGYLHDYVVIKLNADSEDDPGINSWTVVKNMAGNGIPVNWGQHSPYNKYCPEKDGRNCVVGCVAVAVGQLMAFHQWPAQYNGYTYDWSRMINSSTADMTSRLLSEVGVKGMLDMRYGIYSSSAYLHKTVRVLKNMGYASWGKYMDYSFGKIRSEIDLGYPVLMCGVQKGADAGHAWVVDAYALKERKTNRGFEEQQRYLHCNWGWNGSSNGYVLADVFDYQHAVADPFPEYDGPTVMSDETGTLDPGTDDTGYSHKVHMVVGIRPH